jgi:hypothetical protein
MKTRSDQRCLYALGQSIGETLSGERVAPPLVDLQVLHNYVHRNSLSRPFSGNSLLRIKSEKNAAGPSIETSNPMEYEESKEYGDSIKDRNTRMSCMEASKAHGFMDEAADVLIPLEYVDVSQDDEMSKSSKPYIEKSALFKKLNKRLSEKIIFPGGYIGKDLVNELSIYLDCSSNNKPTACGSREVAILGNFLKELGYNVEKSVLSEYMQMKGIPVNSNITDSSVQRIAAEQCSRSS